MKKYLSFLVMLTVFGLHSFDETSFDDWSSELYNNRASRLLKFLAAKPALKPEIVRSIQEKSGGCNIWFDQGIGKVRNEDGSIEYLLLVTDKGYSDYNFDNYAELELPWVILKDAKGNSIIRAVSKATILNENEAVTSSDLEIFSHVKNKWVNVRVEPVPAQSIRKRAQIERIFSHNEPVSLEEISEDITTVGTQKTGRYDISDLDEKEVLRALYVSSGAKGLGYLHYQQGDRLSDEEIEQILKRNPNGKPYDLPDTIPGGFVTRTRDYVYIDYLKGRCMKLDFYNDGSIETRNYNENNTPKAEEIINDLREQKQKPVKQREALLATFSNF